MTTELRKLQLTQLYILLEVKRICEKHNIHYFLVGGTMLGAVRHHGFIPWDDDIDIGMLREEFNKFISVCPTELSDEFYLQTKDTDLACGAAIPKLRLNGTARLDAGSINSDAHMGVDIDIFPYDNLPSNKIKQSLYYYKCQFLRGLLYVKSSGVLLNREKSTVKSVGWKICKILSHFVSREKISSMIDSHFQKYNNRDTEYVTNPGGAYHYTRERVLKSNVSELIPMMFEGIPFPVSIGYDKFLSDMYGDDYMDIPPENKRVQHMIVKLDLGKYTDIKKMIKEKYNVDVSY